MLIFCLYTPIILSQDALKIDLKQMLFNDSLIKNLTIEKVTDMLGRPTATNNNPRISEAIKSIGIQIFYHDKGLMFWFTPEGIDPQKRMQSVEIYLVKKWDENHNEYFLPFPGKILPSVNPNMKVETLLTTFSAYNPKVRTAEETRKSFEEMMQKVGLETKSTVSEDFVDVKFENGKVVFACEEFTKFLEYMTLVFL